MNLPAAVRRQWLWWVAMSLVVVVVLVFAGGTSPDGGTSDDRLYGLAGQLKCLQCVGESVAASQAPLAEQFREEIRTQMATGSTDGEILEFFVERYGEQVLLEPPATGLGALVWVVPVLALGAAVVTLGFAFKRWRTDEAVPGAPGSGEETEISAEDSYRPPEQDLDEQGPGATDSAGVRWPVVVGGLAAFAVLAGWLLVVGSQDRGDGELTGGNPSSGADLSSCQSVSRSDPDAAVECYDDILDEAPDDVQALTYRGWSLLRAGDVESGTADLKRASELDPTYPDARVFLAVAASDRGDFVTAGEELAMFWANDPSDVAVSVVQSEGLERKVFFGLMSAPTRDCWGQAAAAGEQGAIDQVFLDALGGCLDGVLAANPADADAVLSRALAYVGPDTADPGAARSLLASLLAENPDDSGALALLVSLDLAAGDLDGALEGLEVLEDLPRSPAAFLIGDAATLRAAYSAAREASLPNAEGG